MKFKLDENFGTRTQELFRTLGHDVETVRSQNMQGLRVELSVTKRWKDLGLLDGRSKKSIIWCSIIKRFIL